MVEVNGVHDLLTRSGTTRRDGTAMQNRTGRRLAFGEWVQSSGLAALGLGARQVGLGSVVAVPFEGSWPDYAVAYAAVLRAGGVALVVDRALGDTFVRLAVREMGAVGIVCSSAMRAPERVWSCSVKALSAGQRGILAPIDIRPEYDAEIAVTAGEGGALVRVARTHRVLLDMAAASVVDGTPRAVPGAVRSGGEPTIVHAARGATLTGQALLMGAFAGHARLVAMGGSWTTDDFRRTVDEFRAGGVVVEPQSVAAMAGAPGRIARDVSSVQRVMVMGGVAPAELAALAAAFPLAEVTTRAS